MNDDNGFSLEPPPDSQEAERRAKKLARQKAWREANKEKAAAQTKAWREANKERKAALNQAWYQANKEKAAAQTKAWREANKERAAAIEKAWRDANKESRKQRAPGLRLAYKYRMSLESFNAMREAQGNRCKCCKALFGILGARPCVDHCHTTNKVRGLLCHSCNLTLGHAHDNPKILRALARYLERMAEEQETEPCSPPNSAPPSATKNSDRSDCG